MSEKQPHPERLAVASRILAGLLANPNVVGYNPHRGWALVNATHDDMVAHAVRFADRLIYAEQHIEVGE